jgi:hypothetical protein
MPRGLRVTLLSRWQLRVSRHATWALHYERLDRLLLQPAPPQCTGPPGHGPMPWQAAARDAQPKAEARAEAEDAGAEEGDGVSRAAKAAMSDVQMACCIARRVPPRPRSRHHGRALAAGTMAEPSQQAPRPSPRSRRHGRALAAGAMAEPSQALPGPHPCTPPTSDVLPRGPCPTGRLAANGWAPAPARSARRGRLVAGGPPWTPDRAAAPSVRCAMPPARAIAPPRAAGAGAGACGACGACGTPARQP